MGDHSDQSCIIMKFLVAFSAVVAMVSAEADPYLLGYGAGYGYGLGYAGLKSAPCVNAANVPVPCASGYLHYGKREAEAEPYLGYGLGYGYHYGKREAEAEPFYGYAGLGYAGLGYAGLGYGYGIHSSHVGLCTNYLGAAVPC